MLPCRYRKIGGDVCAGGEEDMYKKQEADCCAHHSQPSSSNSTVYVTVDRHSGDKGVEPKVVVLGVLFVLALLIIAVFVVLFIMVSM